MAQFTIKSRLGETTFESNHPNQQALFDRLRHLVSSKEIANDHAHRLISGYVRFQGWKPYHESWAAFYVAKHDHPERFQQGNRGTREDVPGFTGIVEHMQGATEHLKAPIITLEYAPNRLVCLKLTTRGKRPGTISVASSTRFGEGAFYGYIANDGTFERRPACDDDVLQLLQRVANDPATVISEIGRQSGRCCYCPAKLTQVQSKIAGCGKTCADNYGIEYPNAAETRRTLEEHPEYLDGSTDADRWS